MSLMHTLVSHSYHCSHKCILQEFYCGEKNKAVPIWVHSPSSNKKQRAAKRNANEENRLLSSDLSGNTGAPLHLVLVLDTHDLTASLLASLNVVVEQRAGRGGKLLQRGLVLLADLGEGKDGGGLLVHDSAETGLALDDDVRDVHLAAEGGKPDHKLNGFDIVGDDNELGLLLLDELGHVVQTELDELGLGRLIVLLGLGSLSGSFETLVLLLNGLGAVLGQELEEVDSEVLVGSAGELRNDGRNFQALLEDGALALEAHVRGPADIAAQVTLGLDVATFRKECTSQ
jgi:hypothetical protein